MVTEKAKKTGLFEPVKKQDTEKQAHSVGVFLAVRGYFRQGRPRGRRRAKGGQRVRQPRIRIL